MSTILHRLVSWADSDPNAVAQLLRKADQWQPVTAREFCDHVFWLALFFESRGMSALDVASILAYNCPAWVEVELAAVLLGGRSAGLYPNSTSKDIQYILEHTESKFFAVQDESYYQKFLQSQPSATQIEKIKLILVFQGTTSFSNKAISFEEALLQGQRIALSQGSRITQYLAKLDHNAGAFIIYTSGTTGKPKGALLSHDNLIFTSDIAVRHWGLAETRGGLFSFLPLCHIAEKLQNVGVGISQRLSVAYASSFDNVSQELPQVQPSLLLCVPRVWEKMMEGVLRNVDEARPAKRSLMKWALQVGGQMAKMRNQRKTPNVMDYFQWQLADRLVLSKIRFALGISKAEALASGAATLAPYVCQWFQSIGVEIQEAYGQTESTGVICLTNRGENCSGTVGRPPVGIEFKINEDGEMIAAGRNIFKGYLKDDANTEQTLKNGWLYTGDLAYYDSKGRVVIQGRKKEIIKTSGGKMVAPVPIEEAIKASTLISQVCMVGEGRKYLCALITLSEAKLKEVQSKKNAIQGQSVRAAEINRQVKEVIDQVNSNLAGYERIKKFLILAKEFTIADNEMTPTLKMKRNVIEERYRPLIDRLYNEVGS